VLVQIKLALEKVELLLRLVEFALHSRGYRRLTGNAQVFLQRRNSLFELGLGHSRRYRWFHFQQRWRANVKARVARLEILQIKIAVGYDLGLVGKLVANLLQLLLGGLQLHREARGSRIVAVCDRWTGFFVSV